MQKSFSTIQSRIQKPPEETNFHFKGKNWAFLLFRFPRGRSHKQKETSVWGWSNSRKERNFASIQTPNPSLDIELMKEKNKKQSCTIRSSSWKHKKTSTLTKSNIIYRPKWKKKKNPLVSNTIREPQLSSQSREIFEWSYFVFILPGRERAKKKRTYGW